MIGQPLAIAGVQALPQCLAFQFLMGNTEIVGAANQVHARVQSLQARGGVPTLAGQARQSLAEGSIQTFDKSRIEHVSPTESWSNCSA